MKLSLKRWQKGKTCQGFWPVKQLPGVIIMSGWCAESRKYKWHIQAYSQGGHIGRWARDIWGKDWQLGADTVRMVRELEEPFPTRRAALLKLEATLSEEGSALGDML